jgi:adenylate cyclase
LGAVFFGALLFLSDLFSELEARSWDWRLAAIADPARVDPAIKIIMIDQRSLELMAKQEGLFWPWPRALYGDLVDLLTQAGAKGIAFDIVFFEPSQFSGEDDQQFAASIRRGVPVVLSAATRGDALADSADLPSAVQSDPERLARFEAKQRGVFAQREAPFSLRAPLPQARKVDLPVVELLDAAAMLGDVSNPNDSDGVFRHAVPATSVGEVSLLSLPFALLHATGGVAQVAPQMLSGRGDLTVRFAGPSRSYRHYSFYALFQSLRAAQKGQPAPLDLAEFKDSYVLVGMDAPGLLDLRPTPLSRFFPGVEYHATVLDNALKGSFIRPVAFATNFLFLVLLAVVGTFGVLLVRSSARQALVVVATLGGGVGVAFLAAWLGFWLQLVVPVVCVVGAITVALGFKYQLEGHTSRFLRSAFQHYLSHELIARIIENPEQLALGGERRELTIFFCDIEGFTTLSERLDAQLLGQFLNKFLSEMTRIILAHQGTVDKYIGDAIVAFWNAPLPLADHAQRGVLAALACQRRLAELRAEFYAQCGVQIRLRIGLNTGFVSVGNFGSHERFNYTVLGDGANLASRLEGANKFFGSQIMISEATFRQLHGGIPCRTLGRIKVVGKAEPVQVFEPLIDPVGAELQEWEAALVELGRGAYASAAARIAALPPQKLHSLYSERIAAVQQGRAAWSDEWILHEK